MEFGVAAAIGLVIAYLLLGWVAPRMLLAIEERVGPSPADRGLMIGYKIAFLFVAIIAGVVVSMTALMAPVGAIALLVFIGLFVVVPICFIVGAAEQERSAGNRNLPSGQSGVSGPDLPPLAGDEPG